ncbi:hypothetical protein GCK32_004466, partial [Trichostrongylus colubriformis]
GSLPIWAFIIPEILIVVTLLIGLFLQPETKGKALMDQMVEANYGRLENELPRALIRYKVIYDTGYATRHSNWVRQYVRLLSPISARPIRIETATHMLRAVTQFECLSHTNDEMSWC